MNTLLRSLLLAATLLATNTYAYNQEPLQQAAEWAAEVAQYRSLAEQYQRTAAPALSDAQAREIAARLLSDPSAYGGQPGADSESDRLSALAEIVKRTSSGHSITESDLRLIWRNPGSATLLDIKALLPPVALDLTSLFTDLLEQADDFAKLAQDKPENFKPTNPTPEEIKASILNLQDELKKKTTLSDDDVKKLAALETTLTRWQFWDRSPYVDEATIKAATSTFDTTRDRVLQSIQTLSGRTCRWGYIPANFAFGWICN